MTLSSAIAEPSRVACVSYRLTIEHLSRTMMRLGAGDEQLDPAAQLREDEKPRVRALLRAAAVSVASDGIGQHFIERLGQLGGIVRVDNQAPINAVANLPTQATGAGAQEGHALKHRLGGRKAEALDQRVLHDHRGAALQRIDHEGIFFG